jgi:Protein of unknown function (DUF1360)
MHYAFRFLLATLAVWRITHMLAREEGPLNVLQRFRNKLGSGTLGRLVVCFYCLSIWVALPFAWFLRGNTAETLVGWLALSGGAILLERLAREPVELKIEEDHPWDVAAKR